MTKWNEYNSKYVDGKCFVPVTFPYNKPDGILLENLNLDDLIDYIQKKQIKKAYIEEMTNYDFLRVCQPLEHIAIEFKPLFSEYSRCRQVGNKIIKEYDLTGLYTLKHLKSLSMGENTPDFVKVQVHVDLSQIPSLEKLSTQYEYVKNIDSLKKLKTLGLNNVKLPDLHGLFYGDELDTLDIGFSSIESLDGIEAAPKMQYVKLLYNRKLKDINALGNVKNTLKTLRIENCPKIQNFSVLTELENLELLEIYGSNTLPSLNFIKSMKNLKTFVFNVNVEDGDLSPCLNLSYVYSEKNRKHYNLKDKDLPKGAYIRGNEDIEEWRRLE